MGAPGGPWILETRFRWIKPCRPDGPWAGTAPGEVAAKRRRFADVWSGNRLRIVGVVFFAGRVFSPCPAQDPERLTLEQSVQTGLQNSQSLFSARDDVRIANSALLKPDPLYYPTLAFNMNASRYRATDYVALPG
jgi:hypothetical protein